MKDHICLKIQVSYEKDITIAALYVRVPGSLALSGRSSKAAVCFFICSKTVFCSVNCFCSSTCVLCIINHQITVALRVYSVL